MSGACRSHNEVNTPTVSSFFFSIAPVFRIINSFYIVFSKSMFVFTQASIVAGVATLKPTKQIVASTPATDPFNL